MPYSTTNSTEIKQNIENSATTPTNEIIVVGIDHGYGNMKTVHCCFPAAVTAFEKEPVFKDNLLTYNGKFYRSGDGHREFTPEKIMNEDDYILTLAALAQELTKRKLNKGKVYIAAGLPLTWVTEQKERFKAYLLQNDTLNFTFNGTEYHLEIVGADIYPQGFSAVAQKVRRFKGTNLLCDIGNGTVNCLYINNGIPQNSKSFTEKFGTYQCMISAREAVTRKFGKSVEDSTIEEVIRTGTADIDEKYLTVTMALERVLLHFSHLEKETKRMDENHYQLTLHYDKQDETELLIRVLSFGSVVEVISQERFRERIRQRI